MVNGTRSATQVLKAIRKRARELGLTVEQLPKRGKGSHTIWAIFTEDGREVGRAPLTGHAGAMSQTVTRSIETSLEPLFGKGWLDK